VASLFQQGPWQQATKRPTMQILIQIAASTEQLLPMLTLLPTERISRPSYSGWLVKREDGTNVGY